MTERFGRPSEPFDVLRIIQEKLGQLGYRFYPVERETTEALVTEPLALRLKNDIQARGFRQAALSSIITFSGYARDDRELYEIGEVREFWRKLDHQVDELPAVLAFLPSLEFNGPAQHLMLLGTVEEVKYHPFRGGFDVRLADAPGLLSDVLARIDNAALRYHLRPDEHERIVQTFLRGATPRLL